MEHSEFQNIEIKLDTLFLRSLSFGCLNYSPCSFCLQCGESLYLAQVNLLVLTLNYQARDRGRRTKSSDFQN